MFQAGMETIKQFFFSSSSLVSKTLPWKENGSGPGRTDGKE